MTGARETKDFLRYTKPNVSKKEQTSQKVFIAPIQDQEKSGPKWGSPSKNNAW